MTAVDMRDAPAQPAPVEELARDAYTRHHHRDPEAKDWDDLSPDQQRRWIRAVEVVRTAVAGEWQGIAQEALLGQHRAEAALAAYQADNEALRRQLAGRDLAPAGSQATDD